MFFIDKLNVHQTHTGDLDVVGRQLVAKKDLATGKISCGPNAKFYEGSFSTCLTVRCDGEKVEVTGNPSRYNRSENLFGFATFDECISVYNSVLSEFDLPHFTKATQLFYLNSKKEEMDVCSDGALFNHVDFTCNHNVGRGQEVSFLKGLAGQSIGKGKAPYLYPNGKTVDWYKGSKLKYKKVYSKSEDLKKRRSKNLSGATKDQIEYYDRVLDYCVQNGVVREEHSFKRDWLSKHKMQFYGFVKEKDFLPHLNDIENVMNKFQVVDTVFESVADKLLRMNVCNSRQSANSTNSIHEMWRHGNLAIGENVSRSQYYEHKRRLKCIGIDISVKHDISRLPLQIVSSNTIVVTNTDVPDWYKKPSHLSAIS